MQEHRIEIWAPFFESAPQVSLPESAQQMPSRTKKVGSNPRVSASTGAKESAGQKPMRVGQEGSSYDGMRQKSISAERLGAYTIPMSELSKNLKQTLTDFQQVMDELPKPAAGYSVEEVELHLGVNGNGGIALIGKLTFGMEAAIKVKIRRMP